MAKYFLVDTENIDNYDFLSILKKQLKLDGDTDLSFNLILFKSAYSKPMKNLQVDIFENTTIKTINVFESESDKIKRLHNNMDFQICAYAGILQGDLKFNNDKLSKIYIVSDDKGYSETVKFLNTNVLNVVHIEPIRLFMKKNNINQKLFRKIKKYLNCSIEELYEISKKHDIDFTNLLKFLENNHEFKSFYLNIKTAFKFKTTLFNDLKIILKDYDPNFKRKKRI